MNGLPLHPALVHLPLGLAILIPLGALVVTVLAWRGRAGRALFATLAVAQAALVISGWVAMQAGESDEDKVEKVVAKATIHEHEEGAETFVVVGAGVLVALGAAAVLARRPIGRVLVSVGAAGTLAVAGLALAVGHSGGELVYVHGAAQAHLPSGGAPAAAKDAGGDARDDHGGDRRGDHDDDD